MRFRYWGVHRHQRVTWCFVVFYAFQRRFYARWYRYDFKSCYKVRYSLLYVLRVLVECAREGQNGVRGQL